MTQKIILVSSSHHPPVDPQLLNCYEFHHHWPEEQLPDDIQLILWDSSNDRQHFERTLKAQRKKMIVLGEGLSDEDTVYYLKMKVSDVLKLPLSDAVFSALLENRLDVKDKKNLDELIHLNESNGQIEVNNKLIDLTPLELKILKLFLKNPNVLLNRVFFHQSIWPDVHVQSQNFDTHLSNLRKKLGPFSKHIKTVKYRGHILKY